MALFWSIIVPEATTNFVLNPSAESTGNFTTVSASTVTQSTTYARFGFYSYFVDCTSTNDGISLTLSALANAIHNVTLYLRAATTITGAIQVSLDAGSNYNTATVVNGDSATGWARYNVQISAAQSNGSTALLIRNTLNEDFYIDGAQVEAKTGYYTTYTDGDRGSTGSPNGGLYRWTGLRNASTSTRDSQERSGGREIDLYDGYGLATLKEYSGVGMPPLTHSVQNSAMGAGGIYQGSKIDVRPLTLVFDIEGSTFANLHSKRQDLIDLIKPDAVRGNQAVTLKYIGANSTKAVYGYFRYEGGAEFANVQGFDEQPIIRFIAVDPLWYEDNQEQAALTISQSVTNAGGAIRRINGLWQSLGTGLNGDVRAIAVDKARGRIYYGGAFTTGNGVTLNGVGYWNGSTFVAMGGTPGVSGGAATVRALAIAPNGDVWVGGDFTAAGGSTTSGIAKFVIASSTWTVYNLTAGSKFYALAFDSTGKLYGGGDFTNFNGNANSDYAVSYDGTTWSPLAGGTGGIINSITYVSDTRIYFSGVSTRAYLWNGTSFQAYVDSTGVVIAATSPNRLGEVYIAADFTTLPGTVAGSASNKIARFNGATAVSLGPSTNYGVSGGNATGVNVLENNTILFGGPFTSAGGIATAGSLVLWTGTMFEPLDLNPPNDPISVYAFGQLGNDLYVGYATGGGSTATTSAQTAVTCSSTQSTYPTFTITGPTTANTTCTLEWIENQTTDEKLVFSLTIRAGEIVTVNLAPGNKRVVSDWNGYVPGQPLSTSDLGSFHLQAGANTLAAMITGTTTGVTLTASWPVVHWSVDGVA